MRAIWTGAISFGLVNIPVRIYSAVGETSLDLDMLSKKDMSPIRYARISKASGEEVEYKDIVKGYEIEKGHYVVLEDKDFEKASPKKIRSIEIKNFVLENEIDPVYFDKPYYLEPDKNAEKPYALLREALKKSGKVGIAAYVLRNRERIGMVKVMNDVLILNQLRYHADIRDFNELKLPSAGIIKPGEVEIAIKLIDQLTEKFKPQDFHDTYMEELKKLIEAKAAGKTFRPAGGPEPVEMKDLMETLKASLSASKKEGSRHRPAVSGRKKSSSGKKQQRNKTGS